MNQKTKHTRGDSAARRHGVGEPPNDGVGERRAIIGCRRFGGERRSSGEILGVMGVGVVGVVVSGGAFLFLCVVWCIPSAGGAFLFLGVVWCIPSAALFFLLCQPLTLPLTPMHSMLPLTPMHSMNPSFELSCLRHQSSMSF